MNVITRTVLWCLVMAVTLSCDRSIESYLLDTRMEMVTPVVDDGGSMSFKVFCNESSFTVRNLSCEFSNASVISDDNTYDVANGFCQFTFTNVSVLADHNSVISLDVCGANGSSVRVTALYYCQTFRPAVTVSPVTVSPGSSLSVTLTSNHPSLTLLSMTSSASVTGLPSAGVYNSGQTFVLHIHRETVSGTNHTVSAIVYDDYLECEKTVQAEFRIQ